MSRPSTRSTRDSTSCSPLNSRLKEETLLSKQLDVSIKADFEKNRRKMIRRVLILGSGDSGKTTVLKQMRLLHGANGGFDDSYRLSFKEIIRSNCLVSFRALVAGFLLLSTRSGEQDNDLQTCIQQFVSIDQKTITLLTEEVAKLITAVWSHKEVKEYMDLHSSEILIQDTATYFFDNVLRFVQETYLANDQDILMARSPTIKPTETEFHIKDSYFNFIDVGGQKWLRAAWAQFFDNVQAIIFVGSAGGFDQIINNGDSENRLSDSMKLFELTVNNPLLNTIDVILFLNKSDLLEDKIKRISFKKYVPQFTGDDSELKDVKNFLKKKFASLKKNDKQFLYIHSTQANDTKLMKTVIANLIDIIQRKQLSTTGLL